jgi:hypothetical protein
MEGKLNRYELVFDEETMEGVYAVSLVNDPAIQIEALMFSNTEIHNCSLSNEEIDPKIIDSIILKGEKIDTSEWELIDEKVVVDESVYGIDLASTVSTSEGESEQDNEIFKIRYEYSPNTTSAKSREFCIKMTSAGLSYRKEDLIMSNANPGFGAGGASSYNIFLYKGGVNCKHFFSRKIYLKKNNDKMSVFEALKYIGSLDKKSANQAKLPVNPKEVSQVASAENNYWKLATELTDIRMSSVEKRILTSPVLLPEQDIYRNFDGEQCNVFFTADTIEKLQQNFFKSQYQKNSTLEHSEVIDGVFFFESWIVKNPKNDKANELGFDVPVGTWMLSMKVDNDTIWNDFIKTGKVKGFSIDSRLGVQKNTKNKKEKMNYSKVKKMVMESILMAGNLNEFKIDDTLSVFAESLEKDMVVFDVDNNPLANTAFALDGKNYETDENGVISIIEDVKAEESEDVKVEDVPAADVAEVPADAPADETNLQEELDMATKRIEELEVENQSLKAELISVKDEAVKLSAQSKGDRINLNDSKVVVDVNAMSSLERYRYFKAL